MSGLTTPGKLPYPTGTDKVRDGDDAIKALAEAAQNPALTAIRVQNDSVAASSWGSMAAITGEMPSGWYYCLASCLWYPEVADKTVGYTWLNATVSGATLGYTSQAYAGVRSGNNPNSTTLDAVVQFNGGTMNLSIQFGFADTSVTACRGSRITAIRLGPL